MDIGIGPPTTLTAGAGFTDLVLDPTVPSPDQVDRLADAVLQPYGCDAAYPCWRADVGGSDRGSPCE